MNKMLTAKEILNNVNSGDIIISDFNLKALNPNSYNVRLSDKLKIYDKHKVLDLKKDNVPDETITIPEEGYVLRPGVLYIGSTIETIGSDKFISAIDGRSSIGRLGIQVHLTAGFGDIGFIGTYTLEITCVVPVRIYPNFEIVQVYFEKPDGDVDFLYSGRYQHQTIPTYSRVNIDSSQISDYYYKEDNKEEK